MEPNEITAGDRLLFQFNLADVFIISLFNLKLELIYSICFIAPWWRHQMETFSALLALCAGNSPVIGKFPTQRPVTRTSDFFFDLRLNKRLSKQWWGWWFETLSCPLWRHRNAVRCNIALRKSRQRQITAYTIPHPDANKRIITHRGRYKIANILQTVFSNAFSSMKIGVFFSKIN